MSDSSSTALGRHSNLDVNARHAMLSTQGFEVRHTAGHEGIDIHTWHAMRHHDCTWGDTTDRHCWHLERCTRGVQQDVATCRYTQGRQVSGGEPGRAIGVAVMDGPM
jgi:hypothetical protein